MSNERSRIRDNAGVAFMLYVLFAALVKSIAWLIIHLDRLPL